MNILYIWDKGASTASTINTLISGVIGKQTFKDPKCPITHYDASSGNFNGSNIYPTQSLNKMDIVVHLNSDPSNSAPSPAMPANGQQALADYVFAGGVYVGTSYLGKYSTSYSAVQSDFSDNLILFDNTGDVSNYVNTSTTIYDMSFGGNNSITDSLFVEYLKCKSDIRVSSINDVSTNGYASNKTDISNIQMYYGAGVKAGASTLAWFYSSQMRTAGISTPLEYIVAKKYGSGVAINVNQIFEYDKITASNYNTSVFGAWLLQSSGNWFLSKFTGNVKCTLNCVYNICLLGDTIINTDQGNIEIENIIPGKYTICKKPILHITKTISNDTYLVKFMKNSLGKNIPNKDLVMTKNHMINIGTLNLPAKFFINNKNIIKVKNTYEPLYNILMENYEYVNADNVSVETLHPENIMAKLVSSKVSNNISDSLIIKLSESVKSNDFKKLKQINDKFNSKKLDNNKLLMLKNRK